MKTSLRIPYHCYYDDEKFESHLRFLEPYLEIIDEVAMFVEYSHRGYWPLEGQKQLAGVLKDRVDAYHRFGIRSVGLNILDTIGHLNEAWDLLEKPPMQTMIGEDGVASLSCLCPNSEQFRAYTAQRYEILLQAKPDFVWIDDDFRIRNHGDAGPCYCPGCIAKFNAACHRSETFDTLTAAVREAPEGALAVEWEQFWIDSMTDLASFIRKNAHRIQPDLIFGKMTGPAEAHHEWMEAFGAVKGRPGGGFYYDNTPREILQKHLWCEQQMTEYPDTVVERLFEYENFPYMELAKSKTVMEMEMHYALMCGCNGIAVNASGHYDSRIMKDSLELISANHGLFQKMAERTARCGDQGIFCTDEAVIGFRLMEMGLPITGDPRHACAAVLTEKSPAKYTDEELTAMLRGSLFLDNEALDILTERGLGRYCGVKSGIGYDNSVLEVFTDHPVNGEYAGFVRNGWMNFGRRRIPSPVLEPLDDSVEVLAEMHTLHMEKLGPCLTLYRNALGGTVAVSSYIFAHYWQYEAKQVQFKNLFDAMIPGGAPVRAEICAKVVPVLRQNGEGKTVLMLTNMSFDPVPPFDVQVKTSGLFRAEKDGSLTQVPSEPCGSRYRLRIDGLQPWQTVVFTD